MHHFSLLDQDKLLKKRRLSSSDPSKSSSSSNNKKMENDWTMLPDHILINIFSNLPLGDRCKAALSCSMWASVFDSPYLWQRFQFTFSQENDTGQLMCLTKHGK